MPTLEEIVQPAIGSFVAKWINYLEEVEKDPLPIAQDVMGNPFRVAGIQERDLAQSRLTTVRGSKIGDCLEDCAIAFASRHQGCTIDLDGPSSISFALERPNDRIVFIIQSRASSENGGTQAKASESQLLSQGSSEKPIHRVRGLVAEPGIKQEYRLKGDVHVVNGPLLFQWLSGDPNCWESIQDLINAALSNSDVRRAELRYRAAVEGALMDVAQHSITEAQYLASRFRLEQVLGPCRPVLMETPPATVPPDLFDQLAELDQEGE